MRWLDWREYEHLVQVWFRSVWCIWRLSSEVESSMNFPLWCNDQALSTKYVLACTQWRAQNYIYIVTQGLDHVTQLFICNRARGDDVGFGDVRAHRRQRISASALLGLTTTRSSEFLYLEYYTDGKSWLLSSYWSLMRNPRPWGRSLSQANTHSSTKYVQYSRLLLSGWHYCYFLTKIFPRYSCVFPISPSL